MKRLAKLGMCVAVMGALVFAPFATANADHRRHRDRHNHRHHMA